MEIFENTGLIIKHKSSDSCCPRLILVDLYNCRVDLEVNDAIMNGKNRGVNTQILGCVTYEKCNMILTLNGPWLLFDMGMCEIPSVISELAVIAIVIMNM